MYNSMMYLTPTYLNNIENAIEYLTIGIQERIFNEQESALNSIQVGDNLSGKILYLSFPRNIYNNIDNTTSIDIIETNDYKISYRYYNQQHCVYITYQSNTYNIYAKKDSDLNPYINCVRVKLPIDFGVVTSIDDSDQFYEYIKMYDDEDIIPNYEKNTYAINEIPTMQQIDNIEQGIQNIGSYFYKPNGWQIAREWLGTNNIGESTKYGTNMQNISYQDLNRWVNNLTLINFDTLGKLNIWNTNILHVIWDTPYEQEWEEL